MVNLICIAFIVVLIIDCTDIIDSFKRWLSLFLSKGVINTTAYRLKPFDCSLCMTFWLGLFYLLSTEFTIPLFAFNCLLAVLSENIKESIYLLKDILVIINRKVLNFLEYGKKKKRNK